MKKSLLVAFVAILVIAGCSKKEHQHMGMEGKKAMNMTVSEDNEMLVYYTCPMESHKHVHSKEAGKCPECNMDMVKAVVTTVEHSEFWGCPMESHSHVRKTEAGTCEDCGMKLKPMRLVKS